MEGLSEKNALIWKAGCRACDENAEVAFVGLRNDLLRAYLEMGEERARELVGDVVVGKKAIAAALGISTRTLERKARKELKDILFKNKLGNWAARAEDLRRYLSEPKPPAKRDKVRQNATKQKKT